MSQVQKGNVHDSVGSPPHHILNDTVLSHASAKSGYRAEWNNKALPPKKGKKGQMSDDCVDGEHPQMRLCSPLKVLDDF